MLEGYPECARKEKKFYLREQSTCLIWGLSLMNRSFNEGKGIPAQLSSWCTEMLRQFLCYRRCGGDIGFISLDLFHKFDQEHLGLGMEL